MGTDHHGSFLTHANYLHALTTLCGYHTAVLRHGDVLSGMATRIRGTLSPGTSSAGLPLDDIRKSLVAAWGAELILALNGRFASTDDELMRLVNNWAAVQAYYALYHGTQALALARGMPRPDSHPKTQKIFLDHWATRSFELPPLGLSFGPDGCSCGPRQVALERVHAWIACTPTSAWHIAGLALRTTRDDAVQEACRRKREHKRSANRKAWREDESARKAAGQRPRKEPTFPLPQLTAAERADAARSTRPHGMLDYLYRLRIKTNYEDARMFTDGPQPDEETTSRRVHTDIRRLVEFGLLATEIHTLHRVGHATFRTWVRHWLERTMPRDLRLGLASRARLYEAPHLVAAPTASVRRPSAAGQAR